MEFALFDDLVLGKIADLLHSLDDLKNFRLVCTKWNKIGTPFFAKRVILWTSTVTINEEIDTFCNNLDVILAKRLRARGLQDNSWSMKILEKYHQHINFLELYADTDCVDFVVKVLNCISLPELQTLTIVEIDNCGEILENVEIFGVFPKLKRLEFKMWKRFHEERKYSPFHVVVQELINKCGGNLTELKLGDDFRLDLEGCKGSLKSLSATVIPSNTEILEDLDTDKIWPESEINKMLEQVKDSLVELELNGIRSFFAGYTLDDFRPPEMKRLKILKIMATEVVHSEEYLNQKYFPNLETICIQGRKKGAHVNLFLYLATSPMPTVKTVKLFGTKKLDLISKVKQIFPNVKHFYLDTEKRKLDLPVLRREKLFKLFGAFATWGLESLEIIMPCYYKMKDILVAADRLPLDDVKRISLRLLPYSGDDKDSEGDGLGLPDEICHTLMRTKGMEIFEITDISPLLQDIRVVRKFAEENSLPIKILCGKE